MATATRRSLGTLVVLLVSFVLVAGTARTADAADGYKYWNYFHVTNGKYVFAKTGPADYTPKDGSVEAYRYGLSSTDATNAAIHNFDNRSDRYVIPHEELFLGHFPHTPRVRRKFLTLTAEKALGNFEERVLPLSEAEAISEAKRCMSCGQCFECDNCVVYCPQVAVFKVSKAKSTTGRYVDTDYSKCIGCHICKDVCPTGYIQMGLGE